MTTALRVNGQSITLPTGQNAWTAIDTGTTGVGMPSDVQQALFAAIPNSQQGTGQFEGYYLYREYVEVILSISTLTCGISLLARGHY